MAVNKYSMNSKPFFAVVDDDIDDATFLKHPKQGSSGYMFESDRRDLFTTNSNSNNTTSRSNSDYAVQESLQAQISRVENNTIESTQRSLRCLQETEDIGIGTAQELVRQRETLQNCEKKVDEMNGTLMVSQRHIDSIKSVFGGIKNYFKKSRDTPRTGSGLASNTIPSNLNRLLDERKTDTGDGRIAAAKSTSNSGLNYSESNGRTSSMFDGDRSRAKAVDSELDQNLDDISNGLSRLKGLAIGLGEEIEDQSEMVDRLTFKVEGSDMKIQRQNKQMVKLLGKK